MSNKSSFRVQALIGLLLAVAVVVPLLLKWRASGSSVLVVYCAHDSILAEPILKAFESQTGIRLQVRYDEEANKSLGLTNLLIAEKAKPRCDVFWNNQTLGTIRLKREDVLATCDPAIFSRIPDHFKDPDHQWAGFAARLRVFIINTEKMAATEAAVESAMQGASLSSVAIAVPLFGTTLNHYAVLCDQMGLDGLKEWHQSLHDRGIREVRGNGAVKDLVAEGACQMGFTDTDDAFAALDTGKPVKMLPVRLASGHTICLPNSVAMIRNCEHPAAAVRLMEYLLSEEVEVALANSVARQIPLGKVDPDRLPADVRELSQWAAQGIPLDGAAEHDQEVLEWLTKEYTGR